MLISDFADYQWSRVKPLANTGTFVYNGKVNQGKERSNPSDCLYLHLIIMKTKRSKQEQFVVDLCHAFAKYGVSYKSLGDEKQTRLYLWVRMDEAIKSNWDDIVEMSKGLEFRYND